MTNQVHNLKTLENMMPAEKALWKMIQRSQLDGRKFRRQHSVGGFVLDFYCPSERLAVELDGADHYTVNGIENDEERTAYLNSLKIRVLRFENNLVFEQADRVREEIKRNFLSV